jgi:hypothetical protein
LAGYEFETVAGGHIPGRVLIAAFPLYTFRTEPLVERAAKLLGYNSCAEYVDALDAEPATVKGRLIKLTEDV